MNGPAVGEQSQSQGHLQESRVGITLSLRRRKRREKPARRYEGWIQGEPALHHFDIVKYISHLSQVWNPTGRKL